MRDHKLAVAVIATVLAATGCQSSGAMLDVAMARGADRLELLVDESGALVEIEYHIAPQAVPVAVRSAFQQLHPGVKTTGAEREYAGGNEFWELKAAIGSMEVEAMFREDGTLVSEEIQIATNTVPQAVRDAANGLYAGAGNGSWEQIRDPRGEATAYHVKFEYGGKHYKVAISPGGEVLATLLEIPAEFEVPVGS